MQRRPTTVRLMRIRYSRERWIVGQHRARVLDVAIGDRGEESLKTIALAFLELRLERPPAGKAMIARDGEQRHRQLGSWIGAAELAEALFGELAQVVERRALGQLGLRHRH